MPVLLLSIICWFLSS